jgi:hypothetical protein
VTAGIDLVLDHSDAELLDELMRVWRKKRPRNLTRTVYYDGEAALKDFGISLPPQMRSIDSALGWTAKGVHALTDLSDFEGFVSANGDEDPFGVDSIAWDNNFSMEFPAAKVSSAVHGCSFLTVSQGDVLSGEPETLVLARSAEGSAALWDPRRRALKGFLSIVDFTALGEINRMVMYTPEKVVTLTRQGGAWRNGWKAEVRRNPLGVVSVAPLAHKFELSRPLGHSRITRASMGYVDSAIRTIVRSEVSAEFYSAPEYYLFGADVEKFVGDDKWSALMGRIKALDIEDGDDKPDLHRFTGASPQPHTDQLRMWANLFSDDQDLEVKFADNSNPTSADAIFAGKVSLTMSTRAANRVWGQGAERAMQLAVMLRDGLTSIPLEMRTLQAQFTKPELVSPTARADAFSKLATSIEGFGASEVGMEYAGLDRGQIVRLQAERRRASAGDRLTSLVAAAQSIRQGAQGGDSGSSVGVPVEQSSTSGVGAA